MNPDALCPDCLGEAYFVDYHTLKCDDCELFFDESDLIPLPPPITDETWKTTFSDEARLEPEEILGVVL